MVDLASTKLRREAVDKTVDRRSGVLPERRDTRAPDLSPSGNMRSASRGDVGGADELMRTLGLVNKAAGSFQGYAENRFKKQEADNAAQGSIDAATGHVDTELERKSHSYRNSVALGRTMTNFQSGLQGLDEDLRGIIENQDDPELGNRQGEVKERIDAYFKEFAMDPETGELRSFLATPEAKRWLAGSMADTRAKLEASALGKIEERFKGEALTHAGTILGAQIDAGTVDLKGLRKLVPSTVSDDELRSTILTTVQGKAEQLKSEGRYEDALRTVSNLLGEGLTPGVVQSVDIPASGVGGVMAASAAVTAGLSRTPTVGRRRSRDDVINFVLHDLEGGDREVNLGDGGGLTKWGITKRNNPDVDVANLTEAQAKGIAKSRYWQSAYDNANPATAAIAFDAGFINSKSFARELASKYANDPVGALNAYRQRLQDIAKKPDKARFLSGWMARVDKLGTYLGVGPGGQGSDNVIDDPTFALDPEPLDPVEAARRNPGISLAPQMTGGLALRPEERTKLLEYRDQLGREVKQEWSRKAAEKQDETHSGYLLRLSGLGAPLTPTEIADAARRREITPQQTASLLNVIRQDADRDEARAERAANEAERDRDKADEQQAQGIVSTLMGPVYSGQRSTGEALRIFGTQAAGLDPKVRRAVLGAITSEANGIEEVRKNNPALRSATDNLDDAEQEALRRIRGPYRAGNGRTVTAEQQRAIISLEFAKAKRTLFQTAVDKGDVGNLPDQLTKGIATKIRPYLTTQARRR